MNKINSLKEYKEEYRKSIDSPEEFWSEKAESFTWKKKWEKVLKWEFQTPKVEWFVGGQLNITENCLDRHLETRGEKIGILWETNDPNEAVSYTHFTLPTIQPVSIPVVAVSSKKKTHTDD